MIIDYKELKKKYMPPKELIETIKAEKKQKNAERPKKDRCKYTKEDLICIAVDKQWDKKLTKKEQSMFFKDIGNVILDKINQEYTVEEEAFGNGYFIFDFGENSVVHFKIKEMPGWKFGMWFSYDKSLRGAIRCEWFCQYELWLDKFKPSRSAICCDIKIPFTFFITELLTDRSMCSCYYDDILDNLEFMKKHPYLALYRDCTGRDLNINYVSEGYAKRKMKKEIRREKHYDKMQVVLTEKLRKIVEKEINKIDGVKSFKMIDRCVDGWIISPRYDVEIVPHSNDNLQALYDECSERIFNIQQEITDKGKFNKYCIFQVVSHDPKILTESEE